jgi:pyruvate,water dikinase
MRLAPDADSPQARTEARVVEREAALATVRAALAGAPADDRAQFEAGLQAAHVFNPGRERTKTTCILLVHEQRLVALELGRRWAAKGLLQQPEHVFMLADHELDDVAGRAAGHPPMIPLPDHAGLAAEREAHFLTLWQLEPPFVSHGAPPPVASWPRKGRHVEVAAAAGDTLTGIPGCPGVAVGRARVVLDATDPAGLEPGEVLVAPFTDPAWTPLFVPAAAVVVNVGAQITHAVIVSRELGLPCVVSVTGATDRIPDGALVEVDGAAGTVRVLELPARP